MLTFVSCNGAGGGAFSGLESPSDDSTGEEVIEPILISSYTPTLDPVVMTSQNQVVFGIGINGNVGDLTYEHILNNSTVLQSGEQPFYNLIGSSLTNGRDQTLTIKVTNGKATAEKVFNVRKNFPPGIVATIPEATGFSMNCGDDKTFSFSYFDDDRTLDNHLITWILDNKTVSVTTPFAEIDNTLSVVQQHRLHYTPDCTRAGSHNLIARVYDGYDTTEYSWSFTVNNPPPLPGAVQIISFTPTESPVVLTNTNSSTFGVTVADGSGTVGYEFLLDNMTVLQDGGTSFYTLPGNTLLAGFHSLKITASNGITTDTKVFNIRKNTPPGVSSYTPALTGNNISCSGGTITFAANIGDINGDAISVKWMLDNQVVTQTTDFVTTASSPTSASLTYTPDCSKVGFHNVELVLNDGYEESTHNWTVSVNNPPSPPSEVEILTFIPTINPTVLTATTETTLAVSIRDGAGIVNYKFILDNTTTLQDSATPFFLLSGAPLSQGLHSVRLVATNAVSSDEKVFNIRRNTPPNYITYSPELSGATVNCGMNIIFDSTMIDSDNDTLTKTWLLDSAEVTNATPRIAITDTANTGKLVYTSDCDKTGSHTVSVRTFDGYETSILNWTFNVINPAQETLGTTTPSGSTVVVLSTELTKTFTATAAMGIPPYTFKWTLKKAGQPDVVKLIQSNVSASSLILNSSTDLILGNQTLEVELTDASTVNDPLVPARREWTVYRNQRPQITNVTPATAVKTNANTSVTLSALITDANDTFTTTISRGTSACATPSTCGLSSVSLPSLTGTFSARFLSGSTMLGDNFFTLTVLDSYGESRSATFDITANLLSSYCNNLNAGEICTFIGATGYGEEIDLSQPNASILAKIRPYHMVPHNVGLTQKNLIITDDYAHVVWYWNRNNTSVQLGPYTIGANQLKAILGVPGYTQQMAHSTNAGTLSSDFRFFDFTTGNITASRLPSFFLCNPYGLHVETTGSGASQVTTIYVSEACGTHRVVRAVFDNANTTEANIRINQNINNFGTCTPYDLTRDPSSNRLYIACFSPSALVYLDLNNANAFSASAPVASVLVAGRGGGPTGLYPDATPASSAFTGQVIGLNYDSVNGLLYFTEWNTCRLRAFNPTAASVSLFNDALTVPAGGITTITGGRDSGGNWCRIDRLGNYSSPNTNQFSSPRDVVPHYVNGSLKGFIVSDWNNHRVTYTNQTSQAITLGNRSIAANSMNIIFGVNNVAGASNNNGANAGGKNSFLFNPGPTALIDGTLFVADYSNFRIRTIGLDNGSLTTSNGTVSNVLGQLPKFGYNESPTLQSTQVQLNGPMNLKYDQTNNRLLVSDWNNRRIRSINLTVGVVDTLVGNGGGGTQTVPTSPLTAQIQGPRDMDIINIDGSEYLLYLDEPFYVKALNSFGFTANILGTEVEAGRINNVSGINTTGSWGGANFALYNNQLAVTAPHWFPRGMGADSATDSVYIAEYIDNCIKKVDSGGTVTHFAGTCGLAGDTAGAFSSALFNQLWDIEMDPVHPGNFFVLDRSQDWSSNLKYVNTQGTSRNILGIPVPGNNVGKITLSTQPRFSTVIAVNESQICVANGGNGIVSDHGVFCYSRSGSGSLSLYVGNRNAPSLGTNAFRGRAPKYVEDEGVGMGFYIGSELVDPVNIPVQLGAPQGLAFDGEGNLYISETMGHTIRLVKRWY